MERSTHVRIGDKRVPLTAELRRTIMDKVKDYGTGRDTLRCLALGTVDFPMSSDDMNLTDSTKFADYEVSNNTNHKAPRIPSSYLVI